MVCHVIYYIMLGGLLPYLPDSMQVAELQDMYIYIYIYIHTYTYIHIHIHPHTHTHIYMYMYVNIIHAHIIWL